MLAGKPVIRGTRLTVEFVIGLMAEGWSEADILGVGEVEMSDNRHPTCADWVGCVFALILSLGAWPANAGVLSTTDVLAKTGQSIDAWGAAWWQNAFVHPDLLGDTTGEFGYLGNVGGPVFFAEGSGGGAVSLTYTVPNNQYILLPVATYIWTFFDPCASVGCARTIVNSFVSGITDAFASIDGVPVADLTSHLVTVDTTTPFVFQVDAGPIGPDGYEGILDAVQGGLWLMLDPLSSGMHTLTFGATVPSLDPSTGEVLDGSIELATNLQLTAVPEPSTVVLLCGGLALAFGLRSRKRRSRVATTKKRKTPRLLSSRPFSISRGRLSARPGLPIKPGRCQSMTHDYRRPDTTTLFAALSVLEGTVIGRCMQRRCEG